MYALYPKITYGQNIPRWQTKSRRGVFLGYSNNHTSDVPLVLYFTTGHISPQYHVVLNYTFRTVHYISDDEDPPVFWNKGVFESFTHQVMLGPVHSSLLYDEFLAPAEHEEKRKFIQSDDHIHTYYQPSQPSFFME